MVETRVRCNPVDPLTPSSLISKYTYKYLQYNGKSYQFMETPRISDMDHSMDHWNHWCKTLRYRLLLFGPCIG